MRDAEIARADTQVRPYKTLTFILSRKEKEGILKRVKCFDGLRAAR